MTPAAQALAGVLTEARLKLVKPEPVTAPEIHIDQQWREEIKARDWSRVHIEGDRREPVMLSLLRKVHRL